MGAAPTSTTRRLTKGFLATLLAQVITAVGSLVLVPVFLHHWGEQQYGEWLMLYAAVAYMTVVDFGLHMYVVNRLNQAFAQSDMATYHRTLHSAFRLSLTVCSVVIGLMLLVFALAPLADWFQFTALDNRAAAMVGTLLGLQLVGAIPQAQISGIYRTIGEYHRGVMVGNAQRALGFGLTALVVVLGGGPQEVAAAQLIPLALATAYVWLDLRMRHPEIRLGLREGSYKEALTLLLPSFFFFLIQLASGLVLQGTTIVVGSVIGASAVVVFATTRTLANLIVQITGSVNSTLWPDVTTLEAQGRYDTLRELQRLSTKVVMALSLAAAAFLHFNGDPLIRLWTRGEVTYDGALMDAFLLYVLYLGYVNTTTMVLVAANRHRSVAILSLGSTALGIALAIPAASWFGVAGVTGAMLLADLSVRGTTQTGEACKMIAQPVGPYLVEVLGRGALVATFGFGCIWGLHGLIGEITIATMVLSGIACGLIVAGLTFTLWLAAGERQRVLRILRPRPPGR